MAELHCLNCSQELIGLYDFLAHSPKDSKKSDIDKVLKKYNVNICPVPTKEKKIYPKEIRKDHIVTGSLNHTASLQKWAELLLEDVDDQMKKDNSSGVFRPLGCLLPVMSFFFIFLLIIV